MYLLKQWVEGSGSERYGHEFNFGHVQFGLSDIKCYLLSYGKVVWGSEEDMVCKSIFYNYKLIDAIQFQECG